MTKNVSVRNESSSRRRIAGAVALAFVVGSCGTGSDGDATETLASSPVVTEEPVAESTTTAAPTSAAPTTDLPEVDAEPGTIEAWIADVAAILDTESSSFAALLDTGIADVTPDDVDGNVAYCAAEADLRAEFDEALPAAYGSDPIIQELFVPYVDARRARTAGQRNACDTLAGTTDPNEGDVFAMFDATNTLNDSTLAACFPFQEFVRAVFATELNCSGDAIGDRSLAPDTPEGGAVQEGADATAGPTGGPEAGFVLLPAGSNRFDWFPIPFRIDDDDPHLVIAGDDFIAFTRADDTFSFALAAVDEVNDPAMPGGYEIEATIPVPTDLGTWLDQMPVVVLERAEVQLGANDWTRWHIEIDPETAPTPEGEPLLVLWEAGFFGPVLTPIDTTWIWATSHGEGRTLLASFNVDASEPDASEPIGYVETTLAAITIG